MNIITKDRITALCNLNRWRGWTKRPYSVGEHTAIGAWVLDWFKYPDEVVKRWWMHDMHETEVIGDVPTPDKNAYVNVAYDVAVEDFDTQLGAEMGLGDLWWRDAAVKKFDRKMLLIENDLIALRKDPALPAPAYDIDPMLVMIRDIIETPSFAGERGLAEVINYYSRDAKRFGWEAV